MDKAVINELLAEIDRAIAAYEQKRGEMLFELGKVNGALEMANFVRAKLVAAANEPEEEEVVNDAG